MFIFLNNWRLLLQLPQNARGEAHLGYTEVFKMTGSGYCVFEKKYYVCQYG